MSTKSLFYFLNNNVQSSLLALQTPPPPPPSPLYFFLFCKFCPDRRCLARVLARLYIEPLSSQTWYVTNVDKEKAITMEVLSPAAPKEQISPSRFPLPPFFLTHICLSASFSFFFFLLELLTNSPLRCSHGLALLPSSLSEISSDVCPTDLTVRCDSTNSLVAYVLATLCLSLSLSL